MSPISSSSRIQESEPIHNPDPNLTYDVFLSSDSGNAGSKSYTSCLCACLQNAGISVFWDDGSLSGEDHISPSQLQAIQNSRISVVVHSEGYAGSRKCLEVLQQIIEWRRIPGQFVMPVLLGVCPWDAFYQLGEFGRAFDDLTRISKIPHSKWGGCSSHDYHVQVGFKGNCGSFDSAANVEEVARHKHVCIGLDEPQSCLDFPLSLGPSEICDKKVLHEANAAFNQSRKIGAIAANLRDCLAGFARKVPRASSLMGEAITLRDGLILAHNCLCDRILLELDNLQLVESLQR